MAIGSRRKAWALTILALSAIALALWLSRRQQDFYKLDITASPLVFVPLVLGGYPAEPDAPGLAKGVGATYQQCDYLHAIGATWYYSWGREPALCDGVEAVPMLWGASSVGKAIGGNSDWLLGFNEPALSGQANITPAEGAVLWRQVEQAYPGKRLVSPSVLTSGWLDEWWNAYAGLYGTPPRVDAVAAHCYGAWSAAQGVAQCKARIGGLVDWAEAHGIGEVWVTEYAYLPCWPDGEAGSVEFMDGMQTYCESEPMITRWAWFQLSYEGTEPWGWGPLCNTSLVDFETGALTAMGEAY